MSLYIGNECRKINTGGSTWKINYYKVDEVDSIPYLMFCSLSTFSINAHNPGWDGTLEYSTDTKTWFTWDGSRITGTIVYIRGIGNTTICGNATITNTIANWSLNGKDIYCYGNIETLLDWETVKAGNHPVMAECCYEYLFHSEKSLTRAPALPATTLAQNCYQFMFAYCTSLTRAPALPATILAGSCYNSMFRGCTNLTQAPSLPATILAGSCYNSMFHGCTNLTQAPALPATEIKFSSYSSMFQDCTSLTQAPELPATTLANSCYYNMFSGCTNLTTAPELPATTLLQACYAYMFQNCTSLTQAPALPATVMKVACYYNMFYGCTNIKLSDTQTDEYTQPYRIPKEGTGTLIFKYPNAVSYTTADDALDNMFYKTGGTFTGTPSINTTYYLHSSNTIV